MDDPSPRRRNSRRSSSRSASPKRRTSSRISSRSPRSSGQIISIATEEFLYQIPHESDNYNRSKAAVISALELRKEITIKRVRASEDLPSELLIDDICDELDLELTAVIEQYIIRISESARKIARIKIKDYIPTDPSDVGIALPTFSKKHLERVLEKKKEEVTLLMMKEMDAFHFSWYSDDGSLGFNSLIDAWADTVRGNLNNCFLWASIRLYRYPIHFFFTLLNLPRFHFVPLPLCCIFSHDYLIHSEIEKFEEKVDFPDHSLFVFASPCDSVTFSLQI